MTISKQQIIQAATALQSQGARPTTLAVRDQLGAGNLEAINAVLREWQQEQLGDLGNPGELASAMQQIIDDLQGRLLQTAQQKSTEYLEQLRKHTKTAVALSHKEQGDLAHTLDQLIAERTHLLQRIDALQKQLDTADGKLQDALHDAHLATTRADHTIGERDRLLSEVRDGKKELAQLNGEYQKLNDEHAKRLSQLEVAKAHLEQARQLQSHQENQLRDAVRQREEQAQQRQKAETLAARSEQQHTHLMASTGHLSQENQQLKTSLATLERQLQTLTREHQQLAQAAPIATAKADVISGERDHLLNQQKLLNQKLDALTQANHKLNDEAARYKAQAEQEKNGHVQTRAHMETLHNRIRDLEHHLDDLGKTRLAADNRANRIEEELHQQREQLTDTVRPLEEERTLLQQKLDDERQARIEATQRIADLKIGITELESENKKLTLEFQQQTSQLQARVNTLEQELAQAHTQSHFNAVSGS